MKKIYHFIFITFFSLTWVQTVNGQIECQETLELTLGTFTGKAAVLPEQIVIGDIPQGIILDVTEVSCEDISELITVTASYSENGEEFSCATQVIVVDDVPPVAISDLNVEVVLPDGFSELEINPYMIDDGSYDLCSDVSLYTIPSKITCADVGSTITVRLYVVDESLNINSSLTNVTVIGPSDALPNLVCAEDMTISIIDVLEVNIGMISVEPTCNNVSLELIDGQGNIIVDNTIRNTHVGDVLIAELNRAEDNAECSVNITVMELECDTQIFCDTKCHDSPMGDCDSGHTDQDLVEWPCDLIIDEPFTSFEEARPSELIVNYGVLPENAMPQIFQSECYLVGYTYEDQFFNLGTEVKILRNWTLVEWYTFSVTSFQQVIRFSSTDAELLWNICDTYPNSVEAGDCESGRTTNDDIEWPDDVFAVDYRIDPEELVTISKVPEDDAQPQIVANESAYSMTYSDIVESEQSNYAIIKRIWTVASTQNSNIETSYQQLIQIPKNENDSDKITVTTHGGRPMPGVLINDSYITDNKGVAYVEHDDPLVLTYEDDPLLGLDVRDVVLIRDHILGIDILSEPQLFTMDMNGNSIISTIDLVFLEKLIIGLEDVDDFDLGWKFLAQDSSYFSGNKGDFHSYKIGDVDDSAFLNYNLEEETKKELIFDDVLINEGETYELAIRTSSGQKVKGAQISFAFDEAAIELLEVLPSGDIEEIRWRESSGELTLIFSEVHALAIDSEDVAFFTIKFRAKTNETLSNIFEISSEKASFLVNEVNDRVFLNQKIENRITSGVENIELSEDMLLSPNPAQDYISIETGSKNRLKIRISDIHGRILIESRENLIHISQLDPGVYFISAEDNTKNYTGKFIVSK